MSSRRGRLTARDIIVASRDSLGI